MCMVGAMMSWGVHYLILHAFMNVKHHVVGCASRALASACTALYGSRC
jgi:hypothetical protein